MIMLSGLEKFKLVDGRQQQARLIDFAVSLHDGDYPPVTKLIYKNSKREKLSLAWDAVESIDWNARKIIVQNFEAGAKVESEELDKEVLLIRDIRDSMVLDLQNRRATRANDLWLGAEGEKLFLRGAALSARAILRRIIGERFLPIHENKIYDWKYVEFLRGEPHDVENAEDCNLRIARLPPGEISLLTSSLTYLHAAELLVLLPDELAADVFEFMPPDRQVQVFEELNDEQSFKLLTLMKSNAVTSLLSRIDSDAARTFLRQLPATQSERLIELLRYPEDTVGGIMTNEFVAVRADLSVKQAREGLKERLEKTDFAYLIYVVEDEKERRLCGVISLRELLIADDEKYINEIMDEYVTTVQPLEPAREAAYRLLNTHLAAMPVVNHEGNLLGVVTFDAAVAQINPTGWNGQSPRVFT